jgi:hypothetical protein
MMRGFPVSDFEWLFIGFISLVVVMCVLMAQAFPCPFGQTKEDGFWDKEKTQPMVWDYAPSIGGFAGLPGHWQLRPPPAPKMIWPSFNL